MQGPLEGQNDASVIIIHALQTIEPLDLIRTRIYAHTHAHTHTCTHTHKHTHTTHTRNARRLTFNISMA